MNHGFMLLIAGRSHQARFAVPSTCNHSSGVLSYYAMEGGSLNLLVDGPVLNLLAD